MEGYKRFERELPKSFKESDVKLGDKFFLGGDLSCYAVEVAEIHFIQKRYRAPLYKFVGTNGLDFYFKDIKCYCDASISLGNRV